MARPIKFRPIALPRVKIVNRCMLCGRVIPSSQVICSSCSAQVRPSNRRRL